MVVLWWLVPSLLELYEWASVLFAETGIDGSDCAGR